MKTFLAVRLSAVTAPQWGQMVIWLATTAIFPLLVFVGFMLTGRG